MTRSMCILRVSLGTLVLAFGLADGLRAAEPEQARVVRYARFRVGEVVSYGIVEGDSVRQIEGDLFGRWRPTERRYPLADVQQAHRDLEARKTTGSTILTL